MHPADGNYFTILITLYVHKNLCKKSRKKTGFFINIKPSSN